jgi:hypothetical protein
MSERIAPGGCYPPTWPRPPKPPVPEPEPDSLDEQVDWMTYSHPELYAMVHQGLDLTGAMAVSARWARLGDELADIGDELARLVVATGHAWEGESAELARESVSALADWSQDTGVRATEVSGCITVQVDNATTARNAMPAPLHPAGTTTVPSQADAFTSGDFETARPLVSDPTEYTSRERTLHQQAARTMETFQENTRDVYATVPQFAPPSLRKQPRVGPEEQPPQPQPPTPTPQPPVSTAPSAQVGPGGGAPVSGPSGGQAGPGGPSGPGGLPAPSPVAPLGPGGGTGAAEPASGRPAAAAAAASGRPGSPAPGMGAGVPMGGAGGQRGEDIERRSKKYVEEDEDVWGLEEPAMPPVIGEVNRRA